MLTVVDALELFLLRIILFELVILRVIELSFNTDTFAIEYVSTFYFIVSWEVANISFAPPVGPSYVVTTNQ